MNRIAVWLRLLALLSCAHSLIPAAYALAAETNDAADPDPARFEPEIAAFEAWDRQNSFPREAVLFVGSSSIRMWPTAESFPDFPVVNRGFGGSHISDVNYFAERIVLKYSPRLIVFYAGDNDVEAGKSPQQVFDDFQDFAELVNNNLPKTRIVYLPIKPSIARWRKWSQIQAVNSSVAKLAQSDERIIYVDTATPMLGGDGKPRAELFLDDGLHLNAKGYNEWSDKLGPLLRQAMNPMAPLNSSR
jgi:lysophospholipase L1-like esterase